MGQAPSDAAIVLFLVGIGVENPAGALRVAGAYRLLTLMQAARIADPAAMHQLQQDRNAMGVHGIGYLLPRRHMFRIRDARLVEIGNAAEFVVLERTLGDDHAKPAPRAAGVIGGHLVGWRPICRGALARERRHHDAVPEAQASEPKRRESLVQSCSHRFIVPVSCSHDALAAEPPCSSDHVILSDGEARIDETAHGAADAGAAPGEMGFDR